MLQNEDGLQNIHRVVESTYGHSITYFYRFRIFAFSAKQVMLERITGCVNAYLGVF